MEGDHVPKENNHEADMFFLHSKRSCLSIYLRFFPCLHHGLRTMVPGLLITDMAAVAGHTPMSVKVPKMSLAPRIFQFRPSHIPDTQPEGEENQHVNLANLSNRCFFSSLSF